MEDGRIKEILIDKNGSFKEIFLKHQGIERKLQEVKVVDSVSSIDEQEVKALKRLKLKYKDKMQELIEDYKSREI